METYKSIFSNVERSKKSIKPSVRFNQKKLLNFLRSLWALRDSNPRPSGCKPDALNQLS